MMHSHFMIMISALFLLASLAILISLSRHHGMVRAEARQFGGPTGRVQLIWALVPLLILGSVDYALISLPASHVHGTSLNATSTPSTGTETLTIASASDKATSHSSISQGVSGASGFTVDPANERRLQ